VRNKSFLHEEGLPYHKTENSSKDDGAAQKVKAERHDQEAFGKFRDYKGAIGSKKKALGLGITQRGEK